MGKTNLCDSMAGQLNILPLEMSEEMAAKVKMPVLFELLTQEDIWICDSGASSHSTRTKKGATNLRNKKSSSLGHTGSAVAAEMTIDVPGTFVRKYGSLGMEAVL